MSDLISKKELYRKLGEAYNKGFLTWGANEVIKDIIGECDSVEIKGESEITIENISPRPEKVQEMFGEKARVTQLEGQYLDTGITQGIV